jgi:bifunctional non-homologous end joining protein LigD
MMRKASVPRSKRQYVHGHNSAVLRLVRSFPQAKQAIFPGFIPPSLATLAPRPPRSEGWLHEIKYDGYRFQCHIQRSVRFYTRRGNDWTDRLTHLVNALQPFSERSMMMDGEVIVETPEGRSDFHALEKELKAKGGSQRLVFYVFDVLYYGGYGLRDVPLLDRKRLLHEVLPKTGPIKLSEHIEGDGPTILRRACELGLEGIVSKRADARYVSDRNSNWIKVPCRQHDSFYVVGWAGREGKMEGLYLGRKQDNELVYAGKLERGFSEEDKREIVKRLTPLRVRKQPMTASRKSFPKARWVKPAVLVDAEFRGKTGEGLLRHPSFKGIREDLV